VYCALGAVVSPPSEYLSKTLTYWSRRCLIAPPLSSCRRTKYGTIFDASCTTSYGLNSGVTEPNVTEISHKVENWWQIKALNQNSNIRNRFWTPAWRMDDGRQIVAELQHYFHLLSCSPPKLLDRSSPKFYTI